MPAIAIIHRDTIIERVSQGAMLKSIAAEIGVTPAAISNALHDDPEYRKAREIGANARLEDKYLEIEGAQAILDVSRAREGFRVAAWFAEREFPHRWGAKQQIEHTGAIQLEHMLLLDAGALLDGMEYVADIPNDAPLPPVSGLSIAEGGTD